MGEGHNQFLYCHAYNAPVTLWFTAKAKKIGAAALRNNNFSMISTSRLVVRFPRGEKATRPASLALGRSQSLSDTPKPLSSSRLLERSRRPDRRHALRLGGASLM